MATQTQVGRQLQVLEADLVSKPDRHIAKWIEKDDLLKQLRAVIAEGGPKHDELAATAKDLRKQVQAVERRLGGARRQRQELLDSDMPAADHLKKFRAQIPKLEKELAGLQHELQNVTTKLSAARRTLGQAERKVARLVPAVERLLAAAESAPASARTLTELQGRRASLDSAVAQRARAAKEGNALYAKKRMAEARLAELEAPRGKRSFAPRLAERKKELERLRARRQLARDNVRSTGEYGQLKDELAEARGALRGMGGGAQPVSSIKSELARVLGEIDDLNIPLETTDTAAIQRRAIGSFAQLENGRLRWQGGESDPLLRYFEMEGTPPPKSGLVGTGRLAEHEAAKAKLGPYVNFRMVLDSYLSGMPEEERAFLEQRGRNYEVFRQEDIIDVNTQGLGRGVKGQLPGFESNQAMLDTTRRMVQDIVELREAGYDAGLDKYLVEGRLGVEATQVAREEFLRLSRASKLTKTDNFTDLLLGDDHERSHVGRLVKTYEDMLRRQFGGEIFDVDDEGRKTIKLEGKKIEGEFGDWLSGIRLPETMTAGLDPYQRSATELFSKYRDSVDAHEIDVGQLSDYFTGHYKRNFVDTEQVQADFLESVRPYFALDKGKMGKETSKRIRAMMALADEKGESLGMITGSLDGPEISPGTLIQRIWDQHEMQHGRKYKAELQGMSEEEVEAYQARRTILRDRIRTPITMKRLDSAISASRGQPSLQAAAQGVITPRTSVDRGLVPALKELAGKKSNRWIAAGTGALAAVGIVHSIRERDRTPEDLQGPPNLPGGNPYMGPMGGGFTFGSQMEGPGRGGITYDVRGRRDGMDTGRFARQAGMVTGAGSVGGSYYNSMPTSSPDSLRDTLLGQI